MQSLRFDPFRDFDRLAAEVFGTARTPSLMPMDCLRTGDQFVVRFDLPGIDPDSLEVSAVHSLAGLLTSDAELVTRPPFIAPHHTASLASLVGGGSGVPRPGAISCAHRGVLFIDDSTE